jgi:membrane protease YdiL (CAAX protease family)
VRPASLFQLAVLAAGAGIGEEALFRGWLQPALADATSPALGLVLASLLFGLAHALTALYAVLATLIGLYLGLLDLATGNLLVPILVHSVYDFIALTQWRQAARASSTTFDTNHFIE